MSIAPMSEDFLALIGSDYVVLLRDLFLNTGQKILQHRIGNTGVELDASIRHDSKAFGRIHSVTIRNECQDLFDWHAFFR